MDETDKLVIDTQRAVVRAQLRILKRAIIAYEDASKARALLEDPQAEISALGSVLDGLSGLHSRIAEYRNSCVQLRARARTLQRARQQANQRQIAQNRKERARLRRERTQHERD
jgi:hypothetical protein